MSSKGLTKVFSSIVEKVKYTGFSERELRELEEEFLLHLVENDVALDVAEALLRELTSKLSSVKVSRFADKGRVALEVLREVILEPFEKVSGETLEKRIEAVREAYEKPFSVVFLGPNGHGKTTTVAKLAYRLSNLGYKVVIAAADTFRAGAIEQLRELSEKVHAELVSLGYGADPAAVAYEGFLRAAKHGADVLLVDTAGRMHTRKSLLDEMKKIIRVLNPDYRVFVGDALIGNDAVEQARVFLTEVGFDGSILTKFDADTKGGAALSITYITSKPLLYVGVGQRLQDLIPFDYKRYVEELLPSA
ncbi:MAG: signal recognition particle-docking protein FtsY [Thermofilum sp.]